MLNSLIFLTAASPLFWDSDRWFVGKYDHYCSLTADYEDGGFIQIDYDSSKNTANISFDDSKLKSVTNNKNYTLNLIFIKNGKPDSSWGKVKAFGYEQDGHKGISIVLNGRQALDSLATSSLIGLFKDDAVVESRHLEGSAVGIKHLKESAAEIYRTSPSDPLEGKAE